MKNTQLPWLGLDEQARADVVAEQQYHERRITEIVSQESMATWPYVLSDESERHSRLLREIVLASRKRWLRAS